MRVLERLHPPAAVAVGGRRLRSLFLVGAPRCATTSLARALRRHPQLCVSRPKETYFFLRPPPGAGPARRSDPFTGAHFGHLEPGHAVLVEGTPHHLYSEAALERILAFDPEARFVVCVRNPVDLVHSHHARLLFTLDEDERDLSHAWALQETRARGELLPPRCRDPRLVQYRTIGSLGVRLEALFERVGPGHCHVIVYDDVVAKGAGVLPDLLRFAGVAPDVSLRLGHHQRHARYRARWLQMALMNPPRPVARAAQRWERRGGRRAGSLRPLRRRLKQWNTRSSGRPPLDASLRHELVEAFAPDVARLGRLLGRDLSHWLR